MPTLTTHADAKANGTRCRDAIRPLSKREFGPFWEADGVSCQLSGRTLTRKRAEALFLSLKPYGALQAAE